MWRLGSVTLLFVSFVFGQMNEGDLASLKALFAATGGSNWKNKANWDSATDPCGQNKWFGVGCIYESNEYHVQELNLAENNLVGTLTDACLVFPKLRFIYLQGNQLAGPIPDQLWKNRNLFNINIGKNRLSGGISPLVGQTGLLRVLDLSLNILSGPIPAEIWTLVNLEQLLLQLNNNDLKSPGQWEGGLTGSIPPDISNLSELFNLHLDFNKLTGPIPKELWSLNKLQNLYLGNNKLTGSISGEIKALNKLKQLSISATDLTGTIPEEVFSLSSLEVLNLGMNKLTGGVSPQLASLVNLTNLNLNNKPREISKERFSGAFPEGLWGLPKLEFVFMQNNDFEGAILGVSASLKMLDLTDCKFAGKFPAVPPSSSLQQLTLDGNSFTGALDSVLGNAVFSQLTKLSLKNNRFYGFLPAGLGAVAIPGANLGGNALFCPLQPFATEKYSIKRCLPRSVSGANVSSIYAELGSATTHAVRLQGSFGVADMENIFCSVALFNAVSPLIPAVVSSTSSADCVLPPLPPNYNLIPSTRKVSVQLLYKPPIGPSSNQSAFSGSAAVMYYRSPSVETVTPTSVRVQGGSLTVTGSQFIDGLTVVKIDDKEVKCTINSSEASMVCQAPAWVQLAPSVRNIKVANPQGQAAVGSFTYTPDCDVPTCSDNGVCNRSVSPAFCNCGGGYTGSACSACKKGYYGSFCNLCQSCLNGGECKDGISSDGSCDCASGYSGDKCETDWGSPVLGVTLTGLGVGLLAGGWCFVKKRTGLELDCWNHCKNRGFFKGIN
mmetsp:Transcript_49615/g.97304  ORF Transcript_49615/g.97304 Transcript_49615/m.97304 type:complete len:779 (-) Transcript_49615:307-2643(-)|eukprot:CAMPEP_0175157478 /NCGR_PEP_ID=MMETSP0087-20121206/22230_1 /TAXON_ID=136419 /ORGANISM="Unknown Unknown, Strain D1" /LENGTH=778 /DNA_ID=CAMNT_0016445103 /DNA_START=24 /DNA_END=2360 /DNA_ORIENTATION=+